MFNLAEDADHNTIDVTTTKSILPAKGLDISLVKVLRLGWMTNKSLPRKKSPKFYFGFKT